MACHFIPSEGRRVREGDLLGGRDEITTTTEVVVAFLRFDACKIVNRKKRYCARVNRAQFFFHPVSSLGALVAGPTRLGSKPPLSSGLSRILKTL